MSTGQTKPAPRAGTDWMDIRDSESGRLLMRYAPRLGIIEIRVRGRTYTIVLAQYVPLEDDRGKRAVDP